MRSIAIFSDVHGNMPALEAVLKDIEAKGISELYCLGDLVDFAPWSNEVINKIRELNIPCLMGNHDERIAFDYPVVPLSKHDALETEARLIAINHTKAILSESNKAFLSKLPEQLEVALDIGAQKKNLLLVHGSVKNNDEYIYENHSSADLQKMMADVNAEILVMGHTHLPYIRSLGSQLVINCGSVGRSRALDRKATYLILNIQESNIEAEIVSLSYDLQKTISSIRESEIPDFYADFLSVIQ
ncbi:metallophosphoesterase family protein [Mucilaginibacter jinjuensis]|uniref:Metallophosphoesterase family protein n=1 Tax=Mucilaginibacter jinjuensis TaxID=1176721 RepID=A0ABY7T331_9SPHI|nr:metallophosphoesterase family protein [Mucilaginibacter jinjuensis]WCT10704.1 metallophosphoesterase family protein [Mucilaginibacter jinjuensis]